MSAYNCLICVPWLVGSLGRRTRRDHPVACARFAILDRARLPVIRCLPSSVDQRSHVVSLGGGHPDGSPFGLATGIRCNPSEADEDTGHA